MRLLFLLLLLANLIFLIWSGGYFTSADAGHEPQRLSAQLAAERLRLLPHGHVAPGSAAAFCRIVAGLGAAEAEKLGAELGKLAGVRMEAISGETAPTFVVAIPALPSRESATAKSGEVRKLTANTVEPRLDAEGDGTFTLVFREFADEQGADAYLREIVGKGVKSAKVVRHAGRAAPRIEVRGPASALPQVQALLGGTQSEECKAP